MSWLNLNESLNSIKGQISNFASNVLAEEDEDGAIPNIEVEELRKLCARQELEIRKLKAANEELRAPQQNGQHVENAWGRDNHDPDYENKISDLRSQIREIENEKFDLAAQLEQLDTEHQQNVNELVAAREKLKEENMEVKEKFRKLKQQNITIASREEKLKKELEEMKNNNSANVDQHSAPNVTELIEAKKELCVLKSTNATLQKTLESTKSSYEAEIKENIEKLKRIEAENKIIYAELQKSKEEIKRHEAKTIEDEENCQKLVHILDTYEEKVKILKRELEIANEDTLQKEEIAKSLKIELEKSAKVFEEGSKAGDMVQELQKENQCLKEEINKMKGVTEENDFENVKVKLVAALSEKTQLSVDVENMRNTLEKSNEEIRILKGQLEDTIEVKERLQKEVEYLKQELENVKTENCSFIEELENIRKDEEELKTKLESSYQENKKLIEGIEQVTKRHEEYVRNIEQNQKNEELEKLRKENQELLLERNNIHKTYISLITENVRKYYVQSEDSSVDVKFSGNIPEYQEFNKHVENILKILLDFRNKCELLEKDVCDLQQDKNRILNEKNDEIEKLLQNSELLSQEVISKTETLKEYEKECGELMKSNEILITELEGYKNIPGLQTISESNEDSMILLESQLDTAIRRIKELEKVANSNVPVKISERNDLVKTENSEYHLLLNNLDKLQIDYETTKRDLDNARLENEDLRSSLEKCKCEFENTEYQVEELNISIESLKEESDKYRKHRDDLLEENNKLKIFSKNDEDLRTELNSFREKLLLEEDRRKNVEMIAKDLTDKLANSQKTEAALREKCDRLYKELTTLRESKMDVDAKLILENDAKNRIQQKLALHESEEMKLKKTISDLEENIRAVDSSDIESEKMKLQFEITHLHADLDESKEKIKQLEGKIQELNSSRNELIQMVTTKHQESVAYHSEIQRLSQVLQTEAAKYSALEEKLKSGEDVARKNEEIEKLTDQNAFLKEKCEVLARNLLEEQSNVQQLIAEKSEPSEKELSLSKKLERLQSHLMEQEERYTQELLQAEQKNAELQLKVNEIEKREKNSSTMYTSVSIRANQQVEGLQSQLQLAVGERNELRQKISDAEDFAKKQAAALTNLQFVLEQFQKDKEKDVAKETERIRRQIAAERKIQDGLRRDISNLKLQLEESKQGLLAASRLSDQLELSKKQSGALKEEVQRLQAELAKSEENIRQLAGQTDGKVDKSLVKNLVIGYLSSSAHAKDQQQILKIIATVLDFNQQDHDKVGLNRAQQTSWIGSVLSPQGGMSQESLSQAFVRFLEDESKPRVVPSLLDAGRPETGASERDSPRQSPIVLSEIVLPTFADFAQSRNSSSILKDVLKDNS